MSELEQLAEISETLRRWDQGWSVMLEIDKDGRRISMSDGNNDYAGETAEEILKAAMMQWEEEFKRYPKQTKKPKSIVEELEQLEIRLTRENIKATIREIKLRLKNLNCIKGTTNHEGEK